MASVKTTITEQGLALMDSIIIGSGELAFTGIEIGDGENINSSSLATELTNKRMDVVISKVYASEDGTIVCGNVENSTVTESFEIREIGVFAKQEGSEDAPILFAYTECEGIGGIPAASIVAINNEMLITLATGNANVLYVDNPTAAVTRQDIAELIQNQKDITQLTQDVEDLNQDLNENYFTKSEIQSGVQTQGIFGYDPMTGKNTKMSMYFSGDTVTVIIDGKEIAFPVEAGTLALKSELNGKANAEHIHQIEDVQNLPQTIGVIENMLRNKTNKTDLENVADTKQDRYTVAKMSNNVGDKDPNNEDDIAALDHLNCVYQICRLVDWGFNGTAVKLSKLTLFRRGSSTPNGDTHMWCRILRWDGSAWYVAYQSAIYVVHNSYTRNGQRIEMAMAHKGGSQFIPTDEKVVVCFTDAENAPATRFLEFGAKVVSADYGMIASNQQSLPPSPETTYGFNYKFAMDAEYDSAEDLAEVLDGKQDKLTAGDNITIENGVISATGGGTGDTNMSLQGGKVNITDSTTGSSFSITQGTNAFTISGTSKMSQLMGGDVPTTAVTDDLTERVTALEEGGGGSVTVDAELSADSTNPIQNQWLGKRLGATDNNSVQIGYGAKAGTTVGQDIDGSGGDKGYQVAVGHGANGSDSGVAVGRTAYGYTFGVAVGLGAQGYESGVAVGRISNGYNFGVAVGCRASGKNHTVAIGYYAKATDETPIVIGTEQYSSAVIAVSKDGVMSVGGKAVAMASDVGFGINPDGATSHTATQTYDETTGYAYVKDVTATANGYLSCQATQTHESDAANKIILTCSINGTVIHKDCANGYGDMASILIPVANGQTVNVQATSSEPATVEIKFMPLNS